MKGTEEERKVLRKLRTVNGLHFRHRDLVLARALHTANQWSSDQPGRGLSLLSLGTTRMIHSEDHRADAVRDIKRNLAWSAAQTEDRFPNNRVRDQATLNELLAEVEAAEIGKEWLPYKCYFFLAELEVVTGPTEEGDV